MTTNKHAHIIEELTGELRRLRREKGVGAADQQWIRQPLNQWLAQLDGAATSMEEDSLLRLIVGMNESLAIRDALIISTLAAHTPKSQLLSIIASPHSESSVRFITETLDHAFNNPQWSPDQTRVTRTSRMLTRMVSLVPGRARVQPLAVMAYEQWWLDQPQAPSLALQALALDDTCTLAAIVLSATNRSIKPSWTMSR